MPGFNICDSGSGPDSKRDVFRDYRWKALVQGPNVDVTHKDLILDATIPEINFDVLLIQGMSLEYKIPQKPKFNNVSITFYDTGGLQQGFEKWTDMIWNPERGLFDGKAPTNLKGSALIELLDHMGASKRRYKLFGIWPKRISHSKLNMSSDTLKTLVVEFAYDYYKLLEDASLN